MFVYIKTKNLIKGVNEFSFNIDTKREECLYIEDGIEAESDESFQ